MALLIRAACAGLAAVLVLAGCGGENRRIAYTDLTRETGPLEFTRITRGLFRDRAALREVLERNNPGKPIRLPRIDFAHRSAYLVAAGPRSSTGYVLRIVGVEDRGGEIVVMVHEQTPSLGDPVAARVTYPFRLLALPRTDEPVKLKWLGRP
jgi:protease stability complex PrcB-like protein